MSDQSSLEEIVIKQLGSLLLQNSKLMADIGDLNSQLKKEITNSAEPQNKLDEALKTPTE